MKRYQPDRALPVYAFIPGLNIHPHKPGGHMYGQLEPQVIPVNIDCPQEDEVLGYALDLFHLEYYWESHVYFEAFWHAYNRQGCIAHFFKGLILLSAAGVKLKTKNTKAAIRHLQKSRSLLESKVERYDRKLLGFNISNLIKSIDDEISCLRNKTTQAIQFVIHPDW